MPEVPVNPLAWTKIPGLAFAYALRRLRIATDADGAVGADILNRLELAGYPRGEAQFLLSGALGHLSGGPMSPDATTEPNQARDLAASAQAFLQMPIGEIAALADQQRRVVADALITRQSAEARLKFALEARFPTPGDRLREIAVAARTASVVGAPLSEDVLFGALTQMLPTRAEETHGDHVIEAAEALLSPAAFQELRIMHESQQRGERAGWRVTR